MPVLISKNHEVALAFQQQNKHKGLKKNHWEELIKYHA